MQLHLANGSYVDLNININNQRCINWFIAPSGIDGAGSNNVDSNIPSAVKQTAGLLEITDLGGNELRGHFTVRDFTYIVVDSHIYKLDINPLTLQTTSINIGSLNTHTGYVKIIASSIEIMFIDQTDGWIYNDNTNTLTQITDTDFIHCTYGEYLDGYFIINEVGTGTFMQCKLLDGLTWDAQDIATAETKPDNIISFGIARGELWILGTDSMEPWYDAGNPSPGVSFSLRVGLSLGIGCQAPFSVINVNDILYWLDSRGYFVEAGNGAYARDNNTGYQLVPISTSPMHEEFKSYTTVKDCIACQYTDRGHTMIQWSFPSNKKTWVFDTATREWHENLYFNFRNNIFEHSLVQFASVHKGLNIVTGVRNGKVYVLDSKYLDNNGEQIVREKTTPFLYAKDSIKYLTINQLALQMGSVNIPLNGDFSNPKIGLQYSKNGGQSWSSIIWRSLTQEIITWNGLGVAKKWLFKIIMSDSVHTAILDAWLNVEAN